MSMTREQLKAYVHNRPLVSAIEQKQEIDKTCLQLRNAIMVLQAVGANEAAQTGAQEKLDEYNKISKNYSILLEDTWGISWQNEEIISKYAEYPDCDIDQLPSTIKTA